MKYARTFMIFALLLLVGGQVEAQIDRTKKPAPGPAPKAPFPDYYEATLDNGLKILVVPNSAEPMVNFRLLIKSGSEFDGEVAGIAGSVTELLTAGTTTRSSLQFAKEADILGLGIGAGAADDQMSVSGNGLKKHMDKLLTLMTDALYNPAFPQDELEKLKKQSLSGLQSTKRDPSEVMGRLEITVGYAPHPYARFGIEADVEKTTREALVAFHKTYFIPNNASLAIVGDVTPDEILPVVKRYFGSWKKGVAPAANFPKPAPIKGRTVHIVDLGKTQTQTAITVQVSGVERSNTDRTAIGLMNSIIGGGFSGRLFSNLREKHGFTYGAYSNMESRKVAGLWQASAEVRRIATDSAFTQILLEMNRMRDEKVDDETLDMHKQYAAGQFLLGLENASAIAGMVQDIDLYGLPKDYYKTYVSRMMKVSADDVQRVAKKYLSTDNIAFLAVGDASVIKEPLAALGEIRMYDTDIKPVSEAKSFAVDIDGPALLEKHIAAIGGRAVLEQLTSRTTEGEVSISFGPATAEGTMKVLEKAPAKKYQLITLSLDMGAGPQILESEEWVNGKQAFAREPMQPMKELSGAELEKTLESEQFNAVTRWKELGFEPVVTGKKEMNGKTVYVMDFKRKHSTDELYIDAESFLMVGRSEMEETPQGPVSSMTTYGDFRSIDGMTLPFALTVESPGMVLKTKITSYTHNTAIDDAQFSPKKN